MTMVWSISPLLAFFISPILGSITDRCKLALGRRRPVILLLSSFLVAGLILVPWGKSIGILLGDQEVETLNVTVNLLTEYIEHNNTNTTYAITPIMHQEPIPFYKWATIATIIGTVFLDFSADICQTPARTYMLDVCISGSHVEFWTDQTQ